ncbi:hypothetical protein DYB30_006712 [Aphanomyces astaci]|uniref:Rhodanese domain-containing protein n=1 Tax=Aphanomyces astaci TaxID=112090 RepID=A0A397D6N2_APHAT|nr:hypothetical protein DYB30_006712 [Aphanomyces astaci]RQM28171.1 hypothetical protein B5M09_007274 [Aphanomyces astaci]
MGLTFVASYPCMVGEPILNGGFRYWVENDFEVSFPACSIKKDASRVISLDELKALVVAGADTDVQFLDTRSSDEYTGAAAHGNARPGHVPRALHLEWSDTLQPNGQFKSTDELIALVAAAGLSADQPVVTYCQRGIRAAHTAYVLEELLGFPAVRVYEASMLEYLNQPDTKVEK